MPRLCAHLDVIDRPFLNEERISVNMSVAVFVQQSQNVVQQLTPPKRTVHEQEQTSSGRKAHNSREDAQAGTGQKTDLHVLRVGATYAPAFKLFLPGSLYRFDRHTTLDEHHHLERCSNKVCSICNTPQLYSVAACDVRLRGDFTKFGIVQRFLLVDNNLRTTIPAMSSGSGRRR